MTQTALVEGSAVTHVGKVRDHNEDAHVVDIDLGIFVVCDGMGGHAAGEVASSLAATKIADGWGGLRMRHLVDAWLDHPGPRTRRALIDRVKGSVVAAHEAVVAVAKSDVSKKGMGTTVVGAMVVGSELVLAYCGDSRAYLVRDHVATQLTEDHTMLQRMLAAGIDVDTAHDGMRWNSVLTNALGLGRNCKAAVIVVPFARGDQFLLCTDGVTGYLSHDEIAEVLTAQLQPSHAAGCLVDLALARGGGDNATALVVRVQDAGFHARSAAALDRDRDAISACPLWASTISLPQQLRALQTAFPQVIAAGAALPAVTFEDRVAWIVLEGSVEQHGRLCGPGALLYPEALVRNEPMPGTDQLWLARSQVRALALRATDFQELCDEDAELGVKLQAAIAAQLATRISPPPIDDGISDVRGHARGSMPPMDLGGLVARDAAADAALAIALAKLSLDEPSDPEISIEPWIEHEVADAASSRESTQPIEVLRGSISSPNKDRT